VLEKINVVEKIIIVREFDGWVNSAPPLYITLDEWLEANYNDSDLQDCFNDIPKLSTMEIGTTVRVGDDSCTEIYIERVA
jgi:hypothetical protein